MSGQSERAHLHELVDSLAENDIDTATRVLEALGGNGSVSLSDLLASARPDDEAETEGERAGVAEARKELERGEGISHDEAMRRLGLH